MPGFSTRSTSIGTPTNLWKLKAVAKSLDDLDAMNRAASEIPAVRVERQRKLEDLIRLRLAMMRDEEIDQMLAVNLRGAILLVREVVGAIDFLTSPRAAFITGQILPIDGGSS